MLLSCCGRLFRRKTFVPASFTETKLARVLNGLDLTALGIGNTLGAGVYVLIGAVSKEIAGPAIILSFLIAAMASVLAGLCYAEFGSRVPKAGSAYVYSYVTIGECCAFIIGWNLILEYIIGCASVARGLSGYIDALVDGKISSHLLQHAPLHVKSLSPYPDFLAFAIIIFVTIIVCMGVKESTTIINVLTLVNIGIIAFVIICGAYWADINNWKIPVEQLPMKNGTDYGSGGFLPYGSSGLMAGAATCFFAFIGFDVIATTGEEVQNPQKNIPLSILLSLTFCFLAYFGVATVITLMIPYYKLDPLAPLPIAFDSVGWYVAKYIVSAGAICTLATSLLGCMLPIPRVIYAMASDGLLFKFLACVSERFKVPTLATLISGTLAAMMAMFFDIERLVEMMSIGTLLAYAIVSASVIVLRYDVHSSVDDISLPPANGSTKETSNGMELKSPSEISLEKDDKIKEKKIGIFPLLFNPPSKVPTACSAMLTKICVAVLAVLSIVLSSVHQYLIRQDLLFTWQSIVGLSVTAGCALLGLFVLWRQPQKNTFIPFKVPLVPLVPVISFYVNIYLMLELAFYTWIRFVIWMAIGLVIYFIYGIWHSSENPMASNEDMVSTHSVGEENLKKSQLPEPQSKETTKLVQSMFK